MPETPSGAGATLPVLTGLSDWADRYDGYILDLWGVIHNGLEPYPGVLDCLERLKRAGKRTCLLSNAPRRVDDVIARLEEIGVPRSLYDEALSSGEATHRAIADPPDDFHAALGRRCWHLGPPRDNSVHEGLDLVMVDAPEAADFVLNTGADGYDDTLEDYLPVLERAACRGLPMICANPDLTVMMGETIAICAGLLARHYEGLGGRVAYHGKPHPPIYHQCLALLGDMPQRRILAVGDNLLTDIVGANRAGLASLLVAGGIHAGELSGPDGRTPDPQNVAHLAVASNARPDGAIAGLTW